MARLAFKLLVAFAGLMGIFAEQPVIEEEPGCFLCPLGELLQGPLSTGSPLNIQLIDLMELAHLRSLLSVQWPRPRSPSGRRFVVS